MQGAKERRRRIGETGRGKEGEEWREGDEERRRMGKKRERKEDGELASGERRRRPN